MSLKNFLARFEFRPRQFQPYEVKAKLWIYLILPAAIWVGLFQMRSEIINLLQNSKKWENLGGDRRDESKVNLLATTSRPTERSLGMARMIQFSAPPQIVFPDGNS